MKHTSKTNDVTSSPKLSPEVPVRAYIKGSLPIKCSGRCSLVAAVMATLVILMPFKTNSSGFKAEGILSTTYFFPDGRYMTNRSRLFTATVRECDWNIQTRPESIVPDDHIIKWEAGSKDGSIYYISYFNPALQSKKARNNSVGLVEFHSVPKDYSASYIPQIWIAFASSCSLKMVTNNIAPAIFYVEDTLRRADYTVPVELERFNTPPGLPKEIRYFSGGITRAHFKVLEKTNLLEAEVPRSFVYEEFMSTQDASNREKLVVLRRSEGTLIDISRADPSIPSIPKPIGITHIADDRVITLDERVQSVSYSITNGNWQDLKSPIVQANVLMVKESILAQSDRDKADQRLQTWPRRLTLVGIAVLLLVCPLIVAIAVKKTKFRSK